MAEDHSAIVIFAPPPCRRFTTNGTINKQTLVTPPPGARKATIFAEAAAITYTGDVVADGGAMPTDYLSIPANSALELDLQAGGQVNQAQPFGIGSATATAGVSILYEG
jgi:hypothetical protein